MPYNNKPCPDKPDTKKQKIVSFRVILTTLFLLQYAFSNNLVFASENIDFNQDLNFTISENIEKSELKKALDIITSLPNHKLNPYLLFYEAKIYKLQAQNLLINTSNLNEIKENALLFHDLHEKSIDVHRQLYKLNKISNIEKKDKKLNWKIDKLWIQTILFPAEFYARMELIYNITNENTENSLDSVGGNAVLAEILIEQKEKLKDFMDLQRDLENDRLELLEKIERIVIQKYKEENPEKQWSFILGYIYYLHSQKDDMAIEKLEEAIRYDPGNFEALYTLGTLYLRREDYILAYNYFRELEKRYPEQTEPYIGLISLCKISEYCDKEIQLYLETALKNEPKNPVLPRLISITFESHPVLLDDSQFDSYFTHIVELKNQYNTENIYNNLEEELLLSKIRYHIQKEEYNLAENRLDQLFKSNPQNKAGKYLKLLFSDDSMRKHAKIIINASKQLSHY